MERMKYEEIKEFYFNCYLIYCKTKTKSAESKGVQNLWHDGEHELGYAINEFSSPDNSRLAIENLMSEVLSIILNGYRWPEIIERHYSNVEKILASNDLDQMLLTLPREEKRLFVRDLKLLGILPKYGELEL